MACGGFEGVQKGLYGGLEGCSGLCWLVWLWWSM